MHEELVVPTADKKTLAAGASIASTHLDSLVKTLDVFEAMSSNGGAKVFRSKLKLRLESKAHRHKYRLGV